MSSALGLRAYISGKSPMAMLQPLHIPPPLTAQPFSGHLMEDNTNSDNNLQPYTLSIRVWMASLSGISEDIQASPEATAVTTPLNTA